MSFPGGQFAHNANYRAFGINVGGLSLVQVVGAYVK
jgi:hypothetical protein